MITGLVCERREISMKIGIVDVGGGLRGIYAAGVLDWCMENHIHFDCCIGVSAGSANVVSYLAGQKGRNFRFYYDYSFRKEYMGLGHFIRKGSYVNTEYIYGVLSNADGEDPLDYESLVLNPAQLFVVAQEAISGQTKYFDKNDLHQDDYRILMASSSIPFVNRPFEMDGILYYDGALADPVPIQKAFDEGCDRVVLILTKPVHIPREPGKDPFLAKRIQKKYPKSAENLRRRAERYNTSVELAKQLEQQGDVLIVAPDSIQGVSTLTRNKSALKRLYEKGYRDGTAILSWLD